MIGPPVKLLVASNNRKKLDELRRLLGDLEIEIALPQDVGGIPEVEEDRPTFRENAAKKAVSAARATGLWALADDSGLEVEHLKGAPGVLSARWAGVHGDDAANNRLLLERLAGVPLHKRGARFVCALALARPDGAIALEVSGSALGRILNAPRGHGDFGYDPYFLFTEVGFAQTGRGFAELSTEEKSGVSHRGRALRELSHRLGALRFDA
jgi:XTP/dITP diphosphohydrolase